MGTADPGAILAAIERHKVTHVYMPPTLIYMLLAHPDIGKYDYSSLSRLIYAAAPMSVDKLVEAIKVFGPVLTQTYGQAEACVICTFFSPADHGSPKLRRQPIREFSALAMQLVCQTQQRSNQSHTGQEQQAQDNLAEAGLVEAAVEPEAKPASGEERRQSAEE